MAGASADFRKGVDELIAFVSSHDGALPRRRSDDAHERSLSHLYRDLKARLLGPIRGKSRPSEQKLTQVEAEYFKQVELAQSRGGSFSGDNSSADQFTLSPHKRLRQNSPIPAAQGLGPPAAEPGLCSLAAGSLNNQQLSLALQLTLRGQSSATSHTRKRPAASIESPCTSDEIAALRHRALKCRMEADLKRCEAHELDLEAECLEVQARMSVSPNRAGKVTHHLAVAATIAGASATNNAPKSLSQCSSLARSCPASRPMP